MKNRQDYLNLLQETVDFYTKGKNVRGLDEDGDCVYFNNGNMCAVGRCLIKPQNKDKILLNVEGDTTVRALLRLFTQRVFKKEYRGFKVDFWSLLQELHDSCGIEYWRDFNLTEDGKSKVANIKSWININIKE